MYKWNQHSDILALEKNKTENTMDMWCRSEDTYEMIMYIFTAEGWSEQKWEIAWLQLKIQMGLSDD